jgi:hypothetical protein
MAFATTSRPLAGAPATTRLAVRPARAAPSLLRTRAACEPVEAILFDMDGVLTLSEELSRE